VVARIVEQERIVPVRRVDLGVGHVATVVQERLDDFPRARRREAPVGSERYDEKPGARGGKGPGEIVFVRRRGVEVVERPGDEQIGVRVEVLRELVALVAQVGLDLEIDVEMELDRVRAECLPNFSIIASSDRYVMWPIMRARRRPRGARRRARS